MNEDNTMMTDAEKVAWWIFSIAAAVAIIAGVFYLTAFSEYDGDPTVAAGWMTLGSSTAGLLLIPALILSGIRQLLPRLRPRDVRSSESGGRSAEDGSAES